MAELDGDTEKTNGESYDDKYKIKQMKDEEVTLYGVLSRMISSILFPDPGTSSSLVYRIKASVSSSLPLLRDASKNTGRDILQWTRRGSYLRALLVVSISWNLFNMAKGGLAGVGTVALLALTGLLVFMLFFVAVTFNAIVISFLMSVAAAGGFLAFFFACLTAIYIGALSVAVFVISATTISAIIAALIVTGWIGFFWTVWIVTKKSLGLATHSLSVTGSALTAYSSAHHARQPSKVPE
ncbi:hypothetical protein LguiA_005482 [Lonicera macranthoides]